MALQLLEYATIYITGDAYLEPVSFSISRAFNSVSITRCNNIGNKLFISASEPIVIDKRL